MMKGVMMSAIVSVANIPATGQSEPASGQSEPPSGESEATKGQSEGSAQVVNSLVSAGKQAYSSPYTVTVKKVDPVAGTNQVKVTFFVTGDDDPAHDFTETGNQVVAAFLNAGMHANVSGSGVATVEKIEAIEGGDDDSDDDSDEGSSGDALSDATASAAPPATPASAPVQQQPGAGASAGATAEDDDRPPLHQRPPNIQ
jgi:hypothetical protein